ncbi:MAG: cytochrome c maturation protein CcmE [Legionellales bacterium]
MTSTQSRRLLLISLMVLGIIIAVGLTLYALQQNISLFYTPSQVALNEAPQNQLIRIGGLVQKDSVKHGAGLHVSFVVTDNQHQVPVEYEGILPDLFREGQGIVVQGKMDAQGHMQATQVLAKHDENYVPPEVAASLKATENTP